MGRQRVTAQVGQGWKNGHERLLAQLDMELDRASYPVRKVEAVWGAGRQMGLTAILVPTTADEAELDAVVAALDASPLIISATWSVEATS